MPHDPTPRRLDSWKEIAHYLRKNERTAMRWEQDLGLPIRRLAGRSRAGVFAYANELDVWLKQQKEADSESADETPALDGPSGVVSPDAQPASRGNDSTVSGKTQGGRSNVGQARQPRMLHWGLAMGGVLAVVVLPLIALLRPEPTLRLVTRSQITSDAHQKLNVRSDGIRLYVTEIVGGKQQIVVVPTSGGEAMPLRTAIPDPFLEDISPDGANLLLRSRAPGVEWTETPLYVMSATAGEPHPVGSVATIAAIWQADGRGILFVRGKQVWQATLAPYAERLLLSLPATPHDLTLSPNSRQLLVRTFDFVARQCSLWVGNSDGTGFRRILEGSTLPAEWSPDGDRLLYLDNPEGGDGVFNVTSLEPSSTPLLHDRVKSVDSRGAGRVLGLYRRGRDLFVLARSADSAQILRYDPQARSFRRILDGLPAVDVTYSPDHRRLAYVRWPDQTLWTAQADGSARQQITFSPLSAMLPRFSPDGSRLAVTASTPGSPWRIWIMPAGGGAMERLTRSESSEHSEGAPTWLPDGKSIVFADIVCESPAASSCRVHQVDLETRLASALPGSEGLRTARVSPNGRFVAALRESTGQLLLFSFKTGRWRELSSGVTGDDLAWTRDSGSIFGYTRWAEDTALLRVSVRDHQVTRVASLSGFVDSAGSSRYWMGLDDQDRPLLFHSFSAPEVYSAEIK